MPSIANYVRIYLKNKPYVLEALENGIVNISELSRKIAMETGIKKVGAIKAAIRRFGENVKKRREKREKKVLKILKESRIRLLDKVTVIITDSPLEIKKIIEVKLEDAFVYVTEEANIPKNAINVHRDCGMIVISSPKDIESVPGVVAYLTSLLAWENINVVEFVSCHTDTILIIKREDILKTIEVLQKVIG